MEWREIDLPDDEWVPHGLPGTMRPLPGWAARAGAEARFLVEIADFGKTMLTSPRRFVADLPRGDGRGVLVIPGFGFGDNATLPVQTVLRAAGYRVFVSHILANIKCPEDHIEDLVEVAQQAVERNGEPLMVVGHSRGGMLARGLAVRRPDLVSKTICMGSPLNYEFAFYEIPAPMVGALRTAYRLEGNLRDPQCMTHECPCPYMAAARKPIPPEVDLVSLYTTSDGIVDWRACVVPGARNLEVPGTHLGMGLKPATLRLILQELATSESRTATGTNS